MWYLVFIPLIIISWGHPCFLCWLSLILRHDLSCSLSLLKLIRRLELLVLSAKNAKLWSHSMANRYWICSWLRFAFFFVPSSDTFQWFSNVLKTIFWWLWFTVQAQPMKICSQIGLCAFDGTRGVRLKSQNSTLANLLNVYAFVSYSSL